jgi:hypothetical protein
MIAIGDVLDETTPIVIHSQLFRCRTIVSDSNINRHPAGIKVRKSCPSVVSVLVLTLKMLPKMLNIENGLSIFRVMKLSERTDRKPGKVPSVDRVTGVHKKLN